MERKREPLPDNGRGAYFAMAPAATDGRHHGHDRTLVCGSNGVGILPHVDLGDDRFFDRPS